MEIVDCRRHFDYSTNNLRRNDEYPWGISVDIFSGIQLDSSTGPYKPRFNFPEMVEWTMEHIGYEPDVHLGCVYFKDKEDAITFKMRWA